MAQLKDTTVTGSLEVINGYITGSITGNDAKFGSLTGSLLGNSTTATSLTNMNISQFTNDAGYPYLASTTLTSSELSLSNEDTVAVDASLGDAQVYLPSLSSTTKQYTIKKIDSSQNQVNIFGPIQDSYGEYVLSESWDSGNLKGLGTSNSLHINKAGNLLAVSHTGLGTDAGEVLIYKKNNNTWQKTTTITGSGAVYGDAFGSSIDMNEEDNILVVGATQSPLNGNGEVYIFTSSNDEWTQVDLLSGMVQGQRFGEVVKISDNGDVIVVGAGGTNLNTSTYSSGSAYIYRRDASNSLQWNLEATVTGSIHIDKDTDYFGCSISLSKDASVIAIGDRDAEKTVNNTSTGLAYIYKSGSGGWYEDSVLSGSETFWAQFGFSVSLDDTGDILAVGAPITDSSLAPGTYPGKAYVFRSGSGGWYEETSFSYQYSNDYFGERVELNESGNKLIVTARNTEDDTDLAGRFYSFSSGSSGWTENGNFSGSNRDIPNDDGGYSNTLFGSSLAISEDARVVVVGAPNSNHRKVHIFEKSFTSIANNTPYSLKTQYESVTIQNDSNSNWFIKSSHDPLIYTTLSSLSTSISSGGSVSSGGSSSSSSENTQFLEITGDYGAVSANTVYIISASANGSVTLPPASDNTGAIVRFYRVDEEQTGPGVTDFSFIINPSTGDKINAGTNPGYLSPFRSDMGYSWTSYISLGQYGWATV